MNKYAYLLVNRLQYFHNLTTVVKDVQILNAFVGITIVSLCGPI